MESAVLAVAESPPANGSATVDRDDHGRLAPGSRLSPSTEFSQGNPGGPGGRWVTAFERRAKEILDDPVKGPALAEAFAAYALGGEDSYAKMLLDRGIGPVVKELRDLTQRQRVRFIGKAGEVMEISKSGELVKVDDGSAPDT